MRSLEKYILKEGTLHYCGIENFDERQQLVRRFVLPPVMTLGLRLTPLSDVKKCCCYFCRCCVKPRAAAVTSWTTLSRGNGVGRFLRWRRATERHAPFVSKCIDEDSRALMATQQAVEWNPLPVRFKSDSSPSYLIIKKKEMKVNARDVKPMLKND